MTALVRVLLYPMSGSELGKTEAIGGQAVMKSQVNISSIVDAGYEAVLYLTGDVHQARWDAYWTLMTLLHPEMPEMKEAA